MEIRDINGSAEINMDDVIDIEEKEKTIYNFLKRVIDLCFSFIGLILLSPVLIITVVAIRVDSKGSAIFSQKRIGKNGREFNMYKFRSMVINAEDLKTKLLYMNEMSGPMFKMKDDPRITKVGKFIRKTSIDELPQLVNVLSNLTRTSSPSEKPPGTDKLATSLEQVLPQKNLRAQTSYHLAACFFCT